jgi:phage-related baseplate assembly protein
MTDILTYTAVDLSRLPPPSVVEALSFEQIFADMLARLQQLVPAFDATVESDPVMMLLQVCAYREFLLRARVNDAARAVMPAFAVGADLDHLAALIGIERRLITPANPQAGTPAVYETDDEFRRRMVLAPEGYSVAGPAGAYIFHALSADTDVLDATATSPAAGEVLVTVLARAGDGTASAGLLATIDTHLSDDTRRPLTDKVTVASAGIVPFSIAATVTTYAGPDASIVLAEARSRLDAYLARCRRIGLDVTRSGIFGALHLEGVHNVALAQPAADIVVDRTQAAWCTGIIITNGGVGE